MIDPPVDLLNLHYIKEPFGERNVPSSRSDGPSTPRGKEKKKLLISQPIHTIKIT